MTGDQPGPAGLIGRGARRVAWIVAILFLVGFVVLAEVVLAVLIEQRLPASLASVAAVVVAVVGAVASGLVVFGRLEARERAIAREGQAIEERSRRLVALRGPEDGSGGELDVDASLYRVIDAGRQLVRARYAALAVVGPEQRVERVVSAGPDPEERSMLDLGIREVGLLNAINNATMPLRIDDIPGDAWVASFVAPPPPIKTFLGLPVTSSGVKLGLLYCADKVGPDGRLTAFSPSDIGILAMVANEAALVIATARLLQSAPLVTPLQPGAGATDVADALRADRERIGMELHDGVIQSLYALGLGLEATIQALESDVPLARTRLIQARDTINNVIQEIRNYIVGLRSEPGPSPTLAQRIGDVADELSLTLAVDISPEIEQSLSTAQRQQLYLITREALMNVAKHARATQVNVSVVPVTSARERGAWVLRVWDNGVGFTASQVSATSFGLQTMRERARMLGGKLAVTSRPGQGTEVRLVVPGGTEQELS